MRRTTKSRCGSSTWKCGAQRERESMFRQGRFRLAPKRHSARDSVRDTVPLR